MSFGYKTSWIAVQNRTTGEVANALSLRDCVEFGWNEGTQRAYNDGVFVAGPVRGWTLAHSQWSLPNGFDATSTQFPDWLSALSRQLGVVQFFASFRGTGYYAWAWAAGGELIRGYCAGDGGHGMQIGERTEAELALHDHSPEDAVLAIAGAWSLNPVTLDGPAGVHGSPPEGTVPPKVAAARAYIAEVRRKRGF